MSNEDGEKQSIEKISTRASYMVKHLQHIHPKSTDVVNEKGKS